MKTHQQPIWPPTAEELKRYQEGTLDPGRARQIEEQALDDPLLSEAMEGFAAVPAFDSLPPRSSFVRKTSSPWWHISGWVAGLGIGVLAALWAVPHFLPSEKNAMYSTNPVQQEMTSAEPELPLANDESASDSLDTIHTDDNVNPSKETENTQSDNGEVEMSEMKSKTDLRILSASPSVHSPVKPSTLKGSEAERIYHIRNYKVANYVGARRNDWPPLTPNHVPANYENADQQENDTDNKTKGIPYLDYMHQCVEAFHLENYKEASRHFKTVLDQYPDDVNAQFYGGLCHFHLRQYTQALALFELCQVNASGVFNEEGEYYKALTLLELGRNTEAVDLLQKIAAAGGFYSAQAGEVLSGGSPSEH